MMVDDPKRGIRPNKTMTDFYRTCRIKSKAYFCQSFIACPSSEQDERLTATVCQRLIALGLSQFGKMMIGFPVDPENVN